MVQFADLSFPKMNILKHRLSLSLLLIYLLRGDGNTCSHSIVEHCNFVSMTKISGAHYTAA
jgi:hypothetical protein